MKRPIDHIRDSAGSAKIGDGAPIVAMISMANRLLMVTTTGTYATRLADQIDPKRENINIPWAVNQREISYGSNSPFMAATLLAAAALFQPTYLGEAFPCKEAIEIALAMAKQLAEVADIIVDLQTKPKAIAKALKLAQPNRKQIDVPQTPNLLGRGEHLILAIWRASQKLVELAELFYPKAKPGVEWRDNLQTHLDAKLPDDHKFKEIFPLIANQIAAVMSYRNAFLHPDNTKHVALVDYKLRPDMQIEPPSITITSLNHAVPTMPLVHFGMDQLNQTTECADGLIAWLCELNRTDLKIFEHHVERLPEGKTHAGSRLVWRTVFKDGFSPPQ